MHGVDKQAHVHCPIPQQPSTIVKVREFQQAFKEARNKGQKLRACIRTLSSMGYTAGEFEMFKEWLEEFE
jgi:hypothetical protein